MKSVVFAVLLALPTLALAGHNVGPCKPWSNPGSNKNTEWPEVSVVKFQPNLVPRIAARDYDEIVSVRHGVIVGERTGRTYSDLRNMHEGDGNWCTGPVPLTPAAENEFGFVYCRADDQCVIDWFICHNISEVTREENPVQPGPTALVPPVYIEAPEATILVPGWTGPVGSPGPFPYQGTPTEAFTPAGYQVQYPPSYGGFTGVSGGGGFAYLPCPCDSCGWDDSNPTVPSPVPEPDTYAVIGLGLVAMLWYRRKVK